MDEYNNNNYTNEQKFLQELLNFKEIDEYFANQQHFNTTIDTYNTSNSLSIDTNCFENHTLFPNQNFDYSLYSPFGDELSPAYSSTGLLDITQTHPCVQNQADFENGALFGNGFSGFVTGAELKMEGLPGEVPNFDMGLICPGSERKSKNVKKMNREGPSKNLMAERRRRKRLNDRLSMLRSVVPKVSKMDRTSILVDTIDYMKEMLERINNSQQELDSGSNQQFDFMRTKDMKSPHETPSRNSPKFDVEKRDEETKIEICCAGKPGMLQSTVNTLEAVGLEIQQCVISCFNDFASQISCSQLDEDVKHGAILGTEDIKQALARNAGYGGKCL